MTDTNQEGVIKFQLDFQNATPPPAKLLHELNSWRAVFLRLGLLGQNPTRYDGFGFGNLSRRNPGQADNSFLISGTQTGHLQTLEPQHYATVHESDPDTNQIKASGPIKPSSEALSHGVVYQSCPEVFWVMHLHSPDIFNQRRELNLPCTDPSAKYGTPEMAAEIKRLAKASLQKRPSLLVMTGHEDGILAFGSTAEETGTLVVETLKRCRELP